jgi:hypothetical protein
MIEGFSMGIGKDDLGEPALHDSADTGPGLAADANRVGTDDESGGESPTTPVRDDRSVALLDAVAGFLAAPNSPGFLGSLVGMLSPLAISGDSGARTMLRLLGRALADGRDEELVLTEIVNALDRRPFRSEALVAVLSALLIRAASASSLPAVSAESATLLCAAAQIVRDALDSGRARCWHLLPQLATAVARRNAQQILPAASVAAALPRLWAQMAPVPHDISISGSDQPVAGMTTPPRRIILNGPVEIVVLER